MRNRGYWMISKNEAMPILLEVCPSFNEKWKEHVNDIWDRDSEGILYTDFSAFARHIVNLIEVKETKEFTDVFATIEMLISNADDFVKDAVIVGLLEDIQTIALGRDIRISAFNRYLGYLSKESWERLIID